MVCVCCCPAYLERDIDCISTQYSQLVIEFAGFGDLSFCACPNEIGTLVIDLNATSSVGATFCVFPDSRWVATSTLFGTSAAKGFYASTLQAHTFAPVFGAVSVNIVRVYEVFGNTVTDVMYNVAFVTTPTGLQCQSCNEFLSAAGGQSYLMFASRTNNTLSCNSVFLNWYLQ